MWLNNLLNPWQHPFIYRRRIFSLRGPTNTCITRVRPTKKDIFMYFITPILSFLWYESILQCSHHHALGAMNRVNVTIFRLYFLTFGWMCTMKSHVALTHSSSCLHCIHWYRHQWQTTLISKSKHKDEAVFEVTYLWFLSSVNIRDMAEKWNWFQQDVDLNKYV